MEWRRWSERKALRRLKTEQKAARRTRAEPPCDSREVAELFEAVQADAEHFKEGSAGSASSYRYHEGYSRMRELMITLGVARFE